MGCSPYWFWSARETGVEGFYPRSLHHNIMAKGQAAELQSLLFGGRGGAVEANYDNGLMDAYSDEFYMYEFKVRPCTQGRTHDWTLCDFAHPGETARRRDPRQHPYIAAVCLDFRWAGACPRGDACPLAHGVFEYWLHPSRYRTLLCRDGPGCNRQVCFFAHTPAQLRAISPPQQPLPPLRSPRHHLARDAALQKMLRRRRMPTAAAHSAALMDTSPPLSMSSPCSGGCGELSDCESDLLEQPPPALLDEMQPPVWLEEMLSQIFA